MVSLLRRIAIDITPLQRSKDFRRIWTGLLIAGAGFHFTVVASFVQVFELTGSNTAVGFVGLVGLAGIVLGIALGGTFIDAVDRRTTLMWAQVCGGAGSSVLLLTTLVDEPPIFVVYAAVALIAGSSSIDASARNAIVPRLVGHDLLPSALALNQVVMNATALLGPAVAGLVIANLGLTTAYGVDVCSYLAMFAIIWTIRRVPPEPGHLPETGLTALVNGFRYLRGRGVLQAAFGADLVAMIYGMPRALFPVIAVSQFGRGAEVAGLLFAAPAVGAVLGALTGGWVRKVRYQGRAVLWAVAAWGASVAAFGLVDRLWLALLLLSVAGAADVVSAIFRGTIVQLSVPDHLRGRLSGINYLVVAGGPRLGDLRAGVVATAFSPTFSVVSGGLLCIAGAAVIGLLVPSFRRYEAIEDRPEGPAVGTAQVQRDRRRDEGSSHHGEKPRST
ncbi:MAG TPA: MFS transporter [Actinomycetota bacterium]